MKKTHLLLCLSCICFCITISCSSTRNSESLQEDSVPPTEPASECSEPENPYDEGTGHYAGFEWAEQHNPSSCGGNSTSFIEGCEEYQDQSNAFDECSNLQ